MATVVVVGNHKGPSRRTYHYHNPRRYHRMFITLIITCQEEEACAAVAARSQGLPLLGNLLSLEPQLHAYFLKLSQTYGPICTVILGQKVGIVITSPALAREVLKDQDAAFANRDAPASAWETSYGGANIVWAPYGPQWTMLRRVCIREMLGNASLGSVYDLMRGEVRRTIRCIYDEKGSAVNFGEQIFLLMFNVITGMLWGKTTEGDVGLEFKKVVNEIVALLGQPNLSDFFPWMERFDVQGIQRKTRVLVGRFDKIFQSIIDQRMKGGGGGGGDRDFLQVLLQLKEAGDGKTATITTTQIKALLMDMVLGGTETTSNTLEFALAELMNKPEALHKVQQELDRVVGKDRRVEESDMRNLPYLYAVMKEALRLHPALPLLVPHSPSADCEVRGYTIPRGSRVFFNVWAIHRDPTVWENPTEFLPERFLDAKWDYSGNDFRYFPFGSGRRICAGWAMSERMFTYFLASLVHSFDWSLPDEEDMDLSEKFGIVMKKRVPLVAIATPRLSDSSLYR